MMKHGDIVSLIKSLMEMKKISYINILEVQLEFLDSDPWLEIVDFVFNTRKALE